MENIDILVDSYENNKFNLNIIKRKIMFFTPKISNIVV